ncbi:hypothetical protein [Bradyrhizobium sp. SZCCHNRI3043]|uniref:hypothetical protein n=1 Tax=Bradyrhizobium sp. SZCCHNRI3043 TaxID=3057292 RepID=UPI0028E4D391|nr:hypothetical protein [Bradyrhizobium sp. SZCCHNRI3043]
MNPALPVGGGRTAGLSGRKRTDAAATFSFVLALSLIADHRSRSSWMQHQADSCSCNDDNLVTASRKTPADASTRDEGCIRQKKIRQRISALISDFGFKMSAVNCGRMLRGVRARRSCGGRSKKEARRKRDTLLSPGEADACRLYTTARYQISTSHTC